MIILGIETSCDDTALALIETRHIPIEDDATGALQCRIISSLINSQAELHSAYGGVFPTLAKREHGRNIVPLLEKILKEWRSVTTIEKHDKIQEHDEPSAHESHSDHSHFSDALQVSDALQSFHDELEKTNPDLWRSLAGADFLKDKPAIDAIAVTEGPGLEPALWVGINFARVLSAIWNIPIVPIDHMEGHIVGSLIDPEALQGVWQALKPLPLPAVALLVSGGHTELVSINPANTEKDGDKGAFHYVILGQTKDDAVGEAFDKTARMLGLPYPGGPHISKLSHEAYEAGIPSPVTLPRPMIHSRDLDFSFSGLKTAVLYAVRDAEKAGIFGDKATPAQNDMFRKGMAYELEQSIADVLDAKLRSAIEKMGARSIIIGGGVSANHFLRQRFEKTAKKYDIPLLLPSLNATGDNALMIAIAGALEEEARLDRKLPAFDGELKAKGTKKLA